MTDMSQNKNCISSHYSSQFCLLNRPQDHCEATRLKKYPDPEPNDANVDEVIKLVSEDSPACKEINFNNIQVRSRSRHESQG